MKLIDLPMKLIPTNQETLPEALAFGDILTMLWTGVVASRFDLLMLATGLASYMVLHSHRSRWKDRWDAHKQVQLKEQLLHPTPCTTTKHDQQSYATRLDKHVAKQENEEACAVIEEILEIPSGTRFSFDLVISVLGFCRISYADRLTADDVLEHINTSDVDILIEFINFYIDTNQFRKACDVFERNFATIFESELGEDTEWTLMNAALKCGRISVASHIFETSSLNTAKHVGTIQRWWKRTSSGMRTNFREREVSDVFGRLAHVFNERFPFDDNSDDESTVFLGDDDRHQSDADSDSDGSTWSYDD